MNYIDMNTSDVDTHTDLSVGTEFSLDANTISSIQPQRGGSIFSFLNPFKSVNGKAENAVLDNLNAGKFSDAAVIIENGLVENYCAKDKNGRNILALLYENRQNPAVRSLIDKVVGTESGKKAINEPDNDGNRVAHILAKKGDNEGIEQAKNQGAILSLTNNDGQRVATDSESGMSATSAIPPTNIQEAASIQPAVAPANLAGGNEIDRNISHLFSAMRRNTRQVDSDMTDMATDTLRTPTQMAGTATSIAIPTNTEEFVTSLVKAYSGKVSGHQSGGGKLNVIESMIAGKRKMRHHRKSSKKTSKHSMKRSTADSDTEMNRMHSQLDEMIRSQGNDIHERVVKNIMDLLNVDETKARVYKAILYARVKRDHPNLSNLDRANEMQKLATKENLEQIDKKEYDEMADIIAKKKAEKAAMGKKMDASDMLDLDMPTEEKPKKARKSKKADMTESALTEYSVSTTFSDSE